MSSITIVIPTLGRPGLSKTLNQLKSWRQVQPPKYQDFRIIIFHNAMSSSSVPLPQSIITEIESLGAILKRGKIPLEGAELSFRESLNEIESGYVLPLTDDNLFSEEGFKLALDIAASNKYDWIHFNSITNGHANYLVQELLYETSVEELVSRIGINYSLCCISRSLFRVEMINKEFWDRNIVENRSVFSWSTVLAKSFKDARVALSGMPIEIRKVHEYDKSLREWRLQWSRHAAINNDGYLFPFTVHLGKMYEILIENDVISRSKMPTMMVMEGNILKPLHVEMTNLAFLHAYSLKNEKKDIIQFLNHLELLSSYFPKLNEIYLELREHFAGKSEIKSQRDLRRIEFRYRELVGRDGFSLMKILGSSKTNIFLHPLGQLNVDNSYKVSEWKKDFFVFKKSENEAKKNSSEAQSSFDYRLNFDLENDSFFKGGYDLIFPYRISSQITDNKFLYLIYKKFPWRMQNILKEFFLGKNKIL